MTRKATRTFTAELTPEEDRLLRETKNRVQDRIGEGYVTHTEFVMLMADVLEHHLRSDPGPLAAVIVREVPVGEPEYNAELDRWKAPNGHIVPTPETAAPGAD